MILASDIFSDVRSQLDDDNSGRYTEAADLVPAFNKAVLYLVNVFNFAFDQKKITPESLRELAVNKVLATTGTTTKRVDLTSVTDLWTILGVDPDPVVTGTPAVLSETVNRWAKRMTLEQWNDALSDPFSAASGISIPQGLVRAGYIGPGAYFGDGKLYLMVRPGSIFTQDNIALWYLKNPTKAISGTSTVEFPRSLYGLLVEKVVNYISNQHGPESPYGKVTDKEINQLLTLMLS